MTKPKVLASAHFTKDMVDSLREHFDEYETDGVVRIEVTDHGLWWENPNGSRQFLGATEVFPSDSKRRLN